MNKILLCALLTTGVVAKASDRRTVQQRLAAKLKAKQAGAAVVSTQTDAQREADLQQTIALLQAKKSNPVDMLPVKVTVNKTRTSPSEKRISEISPNASVSGSTKRI